MSASKTGALLLTLAALAAAPGLAQRAAVPLTVGRVELENGSIFTPEEIDEASTLLRLLRRTMNSLHVDTRRDVLRREILFAEGDPYDPELLAETERNLRALGFLASARVVAVDTTDEGRVGVKVVTQESWTLETSLTFAIASGGAARWRVELSEENFLGRGATVGVGLGSDENADFWSLFYRQRRLVGENVELSLDFSDRSDGHANAFTLRRPFYAQDDPWGLDFLGWNNEFTRRWYLSNAGPAGSDPAANERLYAKLPFDERGLEGRFLIRVGRSGRRIWRLGAGMRVSETLYDLDRPPYEVSDGSLRELGWLAEYDVSFGRVQGHTVFPYLWLQGVGRRWVKARFVQQYGTVEDLPVDFHVDLKAGPTGGAVGSTTGYGEDRFRFEGSVLRWFPVGRGFLYLQGAGEAETGGSRTRWYRAEAVAGWVARAGAEDSPWITRAWGEVARGENLSGDRALLLGLDRGIRTLDFDGMAGDHLVRWNLEQGKAFPWAIADMARVGVAVFYGGGQAWWSDEDRSPEGIRHEVGFGVRVGPTRSANTLTTRLDLTWDLDRSGSPVFTTATRGNF